MHNLFHGTVQGLILGSILYAIFDSPIFDFEFYLALNNDNYIPKFSNKILKITEDMERALESFTK
jgi:hypothetical protein